jgi:predicted DsbA family dithiol-disulfide isomerase
MNPTEPSIPEASIAGPAAAPLTIDVVSDVVCPWCFVGKRKLERALQIWSEAHPGGPPPTVRWHAFQLNPDLPPQGLPREVYLERKFGHRAGGGHYDRLRGIGAALGIAFAFESIRMQPNTLDAHRLIALAAGYGLQAAVVEALFRAYFLEGRDLTDAQALVDLASQAGLEAAAARRALADPASREAVAEADRQARQIGVQGVPFFIFNGRLAVSGAQDPEVLVAALREASGQAAPGPVVQ